MDSLAFIDAVWLAGRLADRTKRGITRQVCELIRMGEIQVGMRLPSVRDLAREIGVSPATVSAAWGELRRIHLVGGRGRTGVHVCGDTAAPRPTRFQSTGHFPDGVLDLILAGPDPQVLPPLGDALRAAAAADGLNTYVRVPITNRLQRAIAPRWPYPAPAYVATSGGFDAVHVTLRALLLPGSTVAIEIPTAMRLLDILDGVGAQVVPVACDGDGPMPAALKAALQHRPAAFLFQPRTHAVTGHTVTRSRLDELAEILDGTDVLVIEDDGLGDLSKGPLASLGAYFPGRVVHIRSLSKALGPDLRLAVLSTTRDMAARIQGYRAFGIGWTSRLLQEAAAILLEDPATDAIVDRARRVYAERRRALLAALGRQGIGLPDRDGLAVWVPVREESFALVTFAARNIAVMPGSKCGVSDAAPHVRIATSMLAGHYDRVAEAVALAQPEGPTNPGADRAALAI